LTRPAAALKKNARLHMTFDVTCQSCDASFEVDLADLLEDSKLECPHCESRAPRAAVEGVTSALDELFGQLAILRRKFTVIVDIESDDLPPPHDRDNRRVAAEDEDEEESDDEEDWDEGEAEDEEPEEEDR
jgi:hypothetical protein